MEKEKVNQFLMANASNLPETASLQLRERLESLDDSRANQLMMTPLKNPTTVLILSLLVGNLGVDRFILGQTGLGVAKLLTCGAAGIWSLIDIFTAIKRTKEYNMNLILKNL